MEKDAAVARLETAKANENAANANKATEELRRQNLALEQATSPRILNEAGSFKNTRQAGDLRPGEPRFLHSFEGVTIEYFRRAGSADPDPNQTKREAAARALAEELKRQNIETTLVPTVGAPDVQETLRSSGMIIEAIRVTVGPKPTRYFLGQRYPWLREETERFEKLEEEARQKVIDALRRFKERP